MRRALLAATLLLALAAAAFAGYEYGLARITPEIIAVRNLCLAPETPETRARVAAAFGPESPEAHTLEGE